MFADYSMGETKEGERGELCLPGTNMG